MRLRPSLAALLGPPLALVGNAAQAEPGQTDTISGTTAAQVIEPGAIAKLGDLRFGAFASPPTAATMTITANGAVSATGEVATTMTIYSTPADRGPARFRIQGTNSRFFIPSHPSSMTISNGSSTMLIDQMSDNVFILGVLNTAGQFEYRIGGRLRVGANQPTGEYRGDFQITVLFL